MLQGELIMRNSRYTSNGHSHQSLLKRAKFLKRKKPGLSLKNAKNQVAQEIGFRNWLSIVNESVDPIRDGFYYDGFRFKDKYHSDYKKYLSDKSQEDTLINYRLFLIESYSRLKDEYLDSLKKSVDQSSTSLNNQVLEQFASNGIASLLPQNLPDQMLIALQKEFELMDNEYFDDSQESEVGIAACTVLILLSGAVDANEKGEFKISMDDFGERAGSYRLFLALEKFSRVMDVEYNKPLVKSIFDADYVLDLKLPANFEELGKEIFGF